MKNLKPYKDDCFDIHKRAVNKKQAGDLKERLTKLNPNVEAEYKIFLERFTANQLGQIKPNTELGLSKADLLTLYSYQSSVIISVRENIRKLQIKTIITTCQNCTIDTANTLDHLLPKTSYPEFVVNPKNLFPCCSTCNSYKLDSTESKAGQKFLNLYLDDLPKEQYLFVNVFLDTNNDLDFRFHLKNIDSKIEVTIFSIIESHYEKLHLFDRMKLKSIEYVSELESRILAFRHRLSIDEIVIHLTTAVNDEKEAYGHNHWKCILELALLNSPAFMDKFKPT